MRPDTPVVTNADLGRIDEADPTTPPKAADQKTAPGDQGAGQQLNQPVVADQPGKGLFGNYCENGMKMTIGIM